MVAERGSFLNHSLLPKHTMYDSDEENPASQAWAAGDLDAIAKGAAKFTTKIPPSFDGRLSWFQYEDLVEEWLDITSLDAEKQGPALRSRLDLSLIHI